MTSVTVVRMMLELWAGSMPAFFHQQRDGCPRESCAYQVDQHAQADDHPQEGVAVPDPCDGRGHQTDEYTVQGAELALFDD